MNTRAKIQAGLGAALLLAAALGSASAQVSTCTSTAGTLSFAQFLNKASVCQSSTPLGKAFAAVQSLECKQKGTYAALTSFGLGVNISSGLPPTGGPQAHALTAGDLGLSNLPAARALGVYNPVQNLAWAHSDFPNALIAELVHGFDDFIFCSTCTQNNAVLKTASDPTFVAIHSAYVASVNTGGLILGCQGAPAAALSREPRCAGIDPGPAPRQRVELLMEAGIWCLLGGPEGVVGNPVRSPTDGCKVLEQNHLQLHHFILDVLEEASLLRKT